MTQSQKTIDPAGVPRRTLASGAQISLIGLGTFGSDKVSAAEIAAAVLDAARIGYRQFDCASVSFFFRAEAERFNFSHPPI